jgi:DNA-binding transcriptional LysR family regulator
MTQSAASQAMQQLEESLKVSLIDRSKRPLVLTAEGEAYLRGVRGVLKSYQRIEEEVRSIGNRLSGQITVASIVSVGLSYMPAATEAFGRLQPQVDVRSQFGSVDRVVEMVAEGEVDFGLVSFPKNTKSIQCIDWQREPMRLVCSADHPLASQNEVSLNQLRGMEMIGFDRRLTLRQEIDRTMAAAGVDVDVRMEFDNADSMIRAIQANRGIGIVPEAAVRRETATGSLRVVACRELRMTRPLGIIFRRPGRLSQAASEFASLLLGKPVSFEGKKRSGSRKLAVDTNTEISPSSPIHT